MSSVETVLNTFGQRVTKLAKINIGKTKTVNGKRRRIENTGKLRNSIGYESIVHPNSFSFNIHMEDYGENVDAGRKPGKYAPPLKILKWVYQKPLKVRDSNGGFKKETATNKSQLAFLVNRKIFQKGIKPTNFLSDPFEQEYKKLPDDLIEAYGLDVDKFLQSTLNKL